MASSDETKVHRVLLNAPEDWDTWFLIFKTYAQGKQVWEYVDPDTAKEPVRPVLPVMPEGDLTADVRADIQLRISLYNAQHSSFKEVNQGLQSLLDWIQTTVSHRWLFQLNGQSSIRDKVKALKAALDTNEVTKRLLAQQQLAQAYTGLTSKTVDKWVVNLLDCVAKAERLKAYETRD